MSTLRHTVVLGGGVAGLTAAVALTRAGRLVTLIERRAELGGKAGSYRPPGIFQWVDHCPHVLLGACTSQRWLYEQLGVGDLITWHDRLPLRAGDEAGELLAQPSLPPPFNLAQGLLGLPGLTPRDLATLAAAMTKISVARPPWPDDQTFAAWLGPLTTPTLDRGFWSLLLRSVLNASADEASARYGLLFFRHGLLHHRDAWHLGVPRCPLRTLHHVAPRAWLARHGGQVVLGQAGAVALGPSGFVVRAGAWEIVADEVVLALTPTQARRALDPALTAHVGGALDVDLEAGSIVGAHLWFAEPVDLPPVTGLFDAELDWVFRHDGGRRLAVVASTADAWQGLSPAGQAERAWRTLRQHWPRLPAPVATAACREARATFVPRPGLDARRPGPVTGVPGLVLAGAWTATGWPATMEGAARSGLAAASALVGADLSVPDLPAQGVYRLTCRTSRR